MHTTVDHIRSYALTIVAFGVLIALLYFGRPVFITAIFAVVIALLLEPFVALLTRLHVPRSMASLLVCVFGVMVLYFAGLAAWSSLARIGEDAPRIQSRFTSIVKGLTDKLHNTEDSLSGFVAATIRTQPAPLVAPSTAKKGKKAADVPAGPAPIQEVRIHEDTNPLTNYVVASLGTVYQFVLMSSFVPFLVYFMLSWRDHIYKSFLKFFEGPDRIIVARSLTSVSSMARAFVVGNFMIGVILAMVSWALFEVIDLPYPFLAGLMSGLLSLAPYIGLPLGLTPPVFAGIAGGAPNSTLLFAFLIVLSLHLLAMNVLYPKLVGARVHLNPLVVTFSLMFWGFLWDAPGLLLAIPITAGIKAICDNVASLRPYGRFLGD